MPQRIRILRPACPALLALLVGAIPALAQTTGVEPLTLKQAIEIAQSRSASAALARDRYRAAYWQRRVQRSMFHPH